MQGLWIVQTWFLRGDVHGLFLYCKTIELIPIGFSTHVFRSKINEYRTALVVLSRSESLQPQNTCKECVVCKVFFKDFFHHFLWLTNQNQEHWDLSCFCQKIKKPKRLSMVKSVFVCVIFPCWMADLLHRYLWLGDKRLRDKRPDNTDVWDVIDVHRYTGA